MREIRLIVQADDFGMCQSVNAGIVRAFDEGILTQAMMMAPCPWFPHAALLAKSRGIPVGVHCTLTAEWDHMRWRPLTGGRSLVEDDGTFHRTVARAAERADEGEAIAELVAQAARLGAAGLLPILFDVHMGMVCEPAYAEVCRRFRRPFLYPVVDPHLELDSFEVLSPIPEPCKREWLVEHLETLGPGTHYLQSHPGEAGPELATLTPPDAFNVAWAEPYRRTDLAVLIDPQMRRIVERRGIRLVSAADL